MIRLFFILLLAWCANFATTAQAVFISKGKIEYEKKVNMHKTLEDNSWTREMKDRMPVYHTSYYELSFDSATTVYKAGKEVPDDKWKTMWGESVGEENIVHSNFSNGVYTALKQIFEKKFLVQDSLLAIEWRITDEVRTIAGFDCRKAVGKMYDSLYVVAFYSDQITVPGGPEQYNGLPGTILGLAFPRYYTTWFATKVELVAPKPEALKVPAGKATRVNRKELMDQVKNVFEWGSEEEKQRSFWNLVL
jgi:GLPGLI family protein